MKPINDNTDNIKEVVFNPSATIATPANRSGQRIGISPVPVKPCGDLARNSNIDSSISWKDKARRYLQSFPNSTIKNQSITCSYAQIYLQNPEKFKWAGLAAIVSGKVGESQDDFDFGTDLKDDVFKGNRSVYEDLFWQHLAFQENGIAEIEKLYCAGQISKEAYYGWAKIEQGDVWEGNKDLLFYEQSQILQPIMYSPYSSIWWTLDSDLITFFKGNLLTSPVPGDNQEFPGDNIANFEERWKWIETHILPEWKKFEENPNNQSVLMKSLKEACPSCCN
ncbi:MAG: hypothetical protein R3E32_02380 [Chitinophagales bacterium]